MSHLLLYKGVWKVSNIVSPSRLERFERNERVRRAGWELYDSKLPKVVLVHCHCSIEFQLSTIGTSSAIDAKFGQGSSKFCGNADKRNDLERYPFSPVVDDLTDVLSRRF